MQYKLTLFIELKQYFPPKFIPSEKAPYVIAFLGVVMIKVRQTTDWLELLSFIIAIQFTVLKPKINRAMISFLFLGFYLLFLDYYNKKPKYSRIYNT